LEEFLRQNIQKLKPYTLTVSQVTETVRYNIQWLEHNYKEIHAWLQERESRHHYKSNEDRDTDMSGGITTTARRES
jgi:predicted adenine nucleotide alpha hydrolase (AANH) superfamily ATPase